MMLARERAYMLPPARLDDRLRNLVARGRALPRPRTPAALDAIRVHVETGHAGGFCIWKL